MDASERKELERILRRSREINGDDRRTENLNLLNSLHTRIGNWLTVIRGRKSGGPRGEELGDILNDLNATALSSLRRRARRSVPYNDGTG